MKKLAQNVKNTRPKRSAACKVQTYSLLQSGYYNEQRDLKRALKFSLIEAKAAQVKQKSSDSKKKDQMKKVKEYLKDENKDKLIGKVIDKVITSNLKDNYQTSCKQTNEKANDAVRRFTAHRKFAQNCQPFPNTSLPIDFIEKQQPINSKLSVKQSTCLELISDAKLTTDDFLTFLCFRDYVPLPFSLDKKSNGIDINSTKETRKENSSDLIDKKEWDCKEKALKENKKLKLNGMLNKKKLGQLKEDDDTFDQLEVNKIGQKFNKLDAVKINQMKNQFKNSSTKINQLKSNKLTKLAKINKVKCIEKKINEIKSTNGHLNLKKKVDIKIESELNNKSKVESSLIESTIDEIIKQSIEMNDIEEAKSKQNQKISTSFKLNSSKLSTSKLSSKLSTTAIPKLLKTKRKKDKKLVKGRSGESKARQQFLNTRKLRNGKSHQYQSKF